MKGEKFNANFKDMQREDKERKREDPGSEFFTEISEIFDAKNGRGRVETSKITPTHQCILRSTAWFEGSALFLFLY